MAFSEFMMGTPGKQINVNTLTPQQQDLQKRLMELLQPQLGTLVSGGTQAFEPIADQARLGFRQKTIPSIMERFAATNSLESSALPQELGGAASDLETSLAALKSQYGLQQQGNLMNLLGMMMAPQFSPLYQQRQPGFLESATPSILKALMSILI